MLIILFGPPGSGKTTLGRKVAEVLGYDFYDMDETMPAALREKMSKGELMSDVEREEYLACVKRDLHTRLKSNSVVAGCVLVQEKHRQEFLNTFSESIFFKLEAPAVVLENRLLSRPEHFFNEVGLQKMLDSEELVQIPHVCLDVTAPVDVLVQKIQTVVLNDNGRFCD